MDTDLETLYLETVQKLAYSVLLVNFHPTKSEKELNDTFISSTIYDIKKYFNKTEAEIESDASKYIAELSGTIPYSILIANSRYH